MITKNTKSKIIKVIFLACTGLIAVVCCQRTCISDPGMTDAVTNTGFLI